MDSSFNKRKSISRTNTTSGIWTQDNIHNDINADPVMTISLPHNSRQVSSLKLIDLIQQVLKHTKLKKRGIARIQFQKIKYYQT